jgi:hypothetical protein
LGLFEERFQISQGNHSMAGLSDGMHPTRQYNLMESISAPLRVGRPYQVTLTTEPRAGQH